MYGSSGSNGLIALATATPPLGRCLSLNAALKDLREGYARHFVVAARGFLSFPCQPCMLPPLG